MFKFLIVFILILAFVPTVRRFLFWLVVGRSMVNEQKKYNQKTNTDTRREGDLKVDYVPKDTKGKDPRGGQYVDFEEIKD